MEETIVHCNVKANAEIIARILDCDVVGEEYFFIEPDGTLLIDLPIPTEKVKRIDLLNSNTHIGSLFYPDSDEETECDRCEHKQCDRCLYNGKIY